MKKLGFLMVSLVLSCVLLNAQDRKMEKADEEFVNYAYADAIGNYEKMVDQGNGSEELYKNLGNANYLNANYEKAAKWYEKLFDLESTDVDAEYIYRYAQTLRSVENYEAAKEWMKKFEAVKGDDKRARIFADNPDYLDEIEDRSGRYSVENLAINSESSDFAPSFNGQQLVFSTARDTGIASRKIHRWNNKPFLNLYIATDTAKGEFTYPVKLSKNLNKKTHESSTAFTKDGTTVYFTRNNSENGNFSRDAEGVSRLKIYRADLQEGEWTNIKELPFNGDGHSTAHPTLSADENKLYFASDMEGSLGQSDIFVVDINNDGSYGTPQNLGPKINTEARETFPFVTGSNVLYFASDGHPGLGGLDVFATPLNGMDNSNVVNVGKPVNGAEDDFSFIINEDTKKGFFASNREGGIGSDDIYGFVETEEIDFVCKSMVEGTVKDMETGGPLASAKVSIFNSVNEKITETVSSTDGTFALESGCAVGKYTVVAIKDGYDEGENLFAMTGGSDASGVEITLGKTAKPAPVGTDLFKHLELEPILFDTNKAEIRPDAANVLVKIITYMKEFPEAKVEVRSHTDALGSANYNLNLSDKRAKSTAAFLVSKGIDASRISGKGFGETKLINDCKTKSSCPPEKHQENRRSEFVVVN